MADTKQTKTIGEHHVAAELARRGWAPALTRDGLERTDILDVLTEPKNRRLVEIQVKTARGGRWDSISWPLGPKSQSPSQHEREHFVMVAVPHDLTLAPRNFVVPVRTLKLQLDRAYELAQRTRHRARQTQRAG